MITEIRTLLEQYASWLKESTNLREIDEYVEITTPYLDRHNDYIQIYAKRLEDRYLLSDAGYVINDLELSGFNVDTPRRKEILKVTLQGFGVQLSGSSLEVTASESDFPERKHSLVQAILSVNDLFYTASPSTTSFFHEEVTAWLEALAIRFTPAVKFTGKSGYDHRFDFVIPRSQSEPERVVSAINRPDRNVTQALVFSWYDTRDLRFPDARAYAILNDSDRNIPANVMSAMQSFDLNPVPWSSREKTQSVFTN